MFRTPDGHRAQSTRTRWTGILAAGALLTAAVAPGPWIAPATAESKIARVTKNALYGAGLGLLLGAVTALVIDKDSRDDSIRWGIVLGTFAGFGYGVYSIASGEDDEFFFTDASGRRSAPGFDARTEFVGTHGRWVADVSAPDVSASTGLFGHRVPAPEFPDGAVHVAEAAVGAE